MTSFVEALRRKYKKLTDCHLINPHLQKSPHRIGANLLFPARNLSMDCQQIAQIGSEDELFKTAGHVAELDLAGNKLSSWKEVFILLRCLKNLESLNLSQNPLGPSEVFSNQQMSGTLQASVDLSNIPPPPLIDYNGDDSSAGTVIEEMDFRASSPILRFAAYEPIDDGDMGDADRENTDPPNHHENNPTSIQCISEYQKGSNKCFDSLETQNGLHCTNGENVAVKFSPPIQSAIDSGAVGMTTIFPKLKILALNATFIPWSWVLDLLPRFPNLHTLHVALNNYGADDLMNTMSENSDSQLNKSTPNFPNLKTLYFSDNRISSWWSICRIIRHFPQLEQLILLGNPITHIPSPLPPPAAQSGVSKNRSITLEPCPFTSHPSNRLAPPFSLVHTLGLSETLLARWESVDALGEWMPNLTHLRLGNSLPLFQSWSEVDCRAHVIARLPKLQFYNRSKIDTEERETAEREFVRFHGQVEPSLRPDRYWELERQHGRLAPLADIDLSPKRCARVRVMLDGRETIHDLHLNQKVSQVKRQLLALFDIDSSECRRYRLLYYDQVLSRAQGPEELKYLSRAIHSYQPETGDLFELVRLPDKHPTTHRSA